MWRRNIAQTEKKGETAAIELSTDMRMATQSFEFRPEYKCILVPSVVQRLFSQAISSYRERAFCSIPKRETEHPVQTPERSFHTPERARVYEHFGVGRADKPLAFFLEF